LKESENRYRALFDSIHEAVFVCDFERGFLDANARAIKEYGYR
jgi:PAS domain S-box-containing protein